MTIPIFLIVITMRKVGQLVYETQVFRTKLNYQFTRAWSARLIVEYDSTLANPLLTSLVRTKQVQTQALLTWLPHPGTVIYVGYNNDLQNYSHQLCSTHPDSRFCLPGQTYSASSYWLSERRQTTLCKSKLPHSLLAKAALRSAAFSHAVHSIAARISRALSNSSRRQYAACLDSGAV